MSFTAIQLLLIFVPLALSLYAQYKVSSVIKKYSRVPNSKGLTGEQVAKMILEKEHLQHVEVFQVPGKLSDHYDPRNKRLGLSPDIARGTSISALAVAAHETGHAIQHRDAYKFLGMRSALYPLASFSSNLGPILIFISLIFQFTGLLKIGIILFSASVLFTIVTLPVEFDASARAVVTLNKLGISSPSESALVKKVLSAAALTYVAAALAAVAELVRLILIARSND